MIYLFLYPSASLNASFDQLIEELPPIIQNRILRKKQQKKREASLLGYTLLQRVLSNYFATSLKEITFSSSGKPTLKSAHKSISFNISHSKSLVGLVIGEENTLGLDIEEFRKFDSVEASFSFFNVVEQQAILAASKPDWKLIELWSKKEALIKAVGGKMFDMAADTDVRFESTRWKEETYQLLKVEYAFEGFIWIASLVPNSDLIVKIVQDLSEI